MNLSGIAAIYQFDTRPGTGLGAVSLAGSGAKGKHL
jgi:hypothetical protein